MNIALSRRTFLASSGLTLAVAACGKFGKGSTPRELNAWLSVMPDGATIIRVNATEMGQGAQTGLAQIVADEMDADWPRVTVEMAPVTARYMVKDKAYFTGGSSSIGGLLNQFDAFAQAGATARAMLVSAAAKRWQCSGAECSTANGVVTGPGGKMLTYGDLAEDAAKEPLPVQVTLRTPEQRRIVGKRIARLDIPEKVNGSAVYGIDIKRPGMLYAAVQQCPYQGGKLARVDEAPALAMRGVKHVVKLDSAVAVVADRWWRAKNAALALTPEWTKPEGMIASDDAMFAEMRGAIGAKDSTLAAVDNDHRVAVAANVDAALASVKDIVEREFQVAFLSHSPIEPMNATAEVAKDGCTLWVPTQNQSSMQSDVAKALNLPLESVTIHTPRVGGGFGRRLETDYGVQAALIAQAAGAPVKMIWTREEDMTHDFYRPASIARLRLALNDDHSLHAFDYSGATMNDTTFGGMLRNYPMDIAVSRQKTIRKPTLIGSWRSVDPSITIFFLETLVDEVAHEKKRDPLEYRRFLLKDNPRGLRVLNTAAEVANWGHAPTGHAQGIAFFNHAYWGTAVAEVVELSVDAANRITLHKVTCAIDPGTAINPGAVEAQAQGGIVLGLSAASGEAITLKDGVVEQRNFDTYRILRLASAPEIAVQVLETPGAPIGGCGEPPVPPSMPALGNAIFAATGKRVRRLPFSASGFTVV